MPYLHVTLFSAEDLPASDSIFIGGKSDPYVVFKVGGSEHRSLCHKSNLNPQWNPPERYIFPVENTTTAVLHIKVFDMDFLRRDDLLGTLLLPVAMFEDRVGVRTLENYPISVSNAYFKQNRRSTLKLEICLKATRDHEIEQHLHVWENQSKSFRSGWKPAACTARRQWSSFDNLITSNQFKDVIPATPAGMTGSGWQFSIERGDNEGWLYAMSYSGPWSSSSSAFSRVRRRRWDNVYRLENPHESPVSDC